MFMCVGYNIGVFMIVAWPVLAYLGITMARYMKPALPNGGWFHLHRILVISSLCFTFPAFMLIFIAFRNAPTRGLINLGDTVSVEIVDTRKCVFYFTIQNGSGTVHFVMGIILLSLQLTNVSELWFWIKYICSHELHSSGDWTFSVKYIAIKLTSQYLHGVLAALVRYNQA